MSDTHSPWEARIVSLSLAHFGISYPDQLIGERVILEIPQLLLSQGNVNVPFHATHASIISAVSAVDGCLFLWMETPVPMYFRKKSQGIDAQIHCSKIFYDQSGARPVFETSDPVHIRHTAPIRVTVIKHTP